MADVFTDEKRREIMSRIHSKDTKPELLIRSELHKLGFRFRLHNKNLPGSPDIVLNKFRTVIFINGCFWHGHKNCKYSSLPKTNSQFWKEKILKNIERDKIAKKQLRSQGWHIITVWTCQLRNSIKVNTAINKIVNKINSCS